MGKITIKLLTKQKLVAKIYINAKERTCENYAKYHSINGDCGIQTLTFFGEKKSRRYVQIF